jgi:hypothetical protein
VSDKEPRAGAHQGGGATVGWRREFGATAIGGGGSPEGGRRCPEALLRLGKSKGEVRVEPNWRKGKVGARWWLSPRRGDGIGGAVEFPVRGGAPTVGAVRKATGRGVCPWGALEGGQRKGKEPRHDGGTLLKWRRGEAEEGWGSGDAWREEKHERGGWSRPAGDGVGGMACPHRGGAGVADAQDPTGSGRGREEQESL